MTSLAKLLARAGLLLLGFWDKPGGWAASAGGFPAVTETVAFLMKDVEATS
jgi:hypothetical protein